MSLPKENDSKRTTGIFDASSIFKIPAVFQGLASGSNDRGIISSLVRKVHSLWNGDEYLRDENGNHEKMRQKQPLAKLTLNFFRDLQNRLRNSSRRTDNPDSDDSMRNQGGTVCPSACRHRRHSHISTWNHAMHIHYTDIPQTMWEPYIEYGYLLPFMPWRYYLRALYIPNYELMNVWTHLVPCIYFFYLLFVFSMELSVVQAWPLLGLTLAAAILAGCSSLAHMFHSRSGLHHCRWFMVDYFGITAYAFSSLLAHFYTGAQVEYFRYLSVHYLNVCVTFCMWGFLCFCMTQTGNRWLSLKTSRKLKILVNLFGYTGGAIPLVYRMLDNVTKQSIQPALQYHFAAMLSFILAPVLYSTDFPQKFWPRRFSVFGHSHQIFHVLTAIGIYFDIQAVYLDVSEGPWIELCKQDDYPLFENVMVYILLLITCSIALAVFLCKIIKEDHKHEAPFLEGRVLCSCGLPDVPTHDLDAISSRSYVEEDEADEEESCFKDD